MVATRTGKLRHGDIPGCVTVTDGLEIRARRKTDWTLLPASGARPAWRTILCTEMQTSRTKGRTDWRNGRDRPRWLNLIAQAPQ